MPQDQEPNWQPISALPMIASMIRETLENTEDQYQTLQEAEDKPHVLNDDLVDRVIRLYTLQAEDVELFAQQLARWQKAGLTPPQQQEVEVLGAQVQRLREVGTAILALAAKLKEGTIERVLEKSDLELGLEVLLGKKKR